MIHLAVFNAIPAFTPISRYAPKGLGAVAHRAYSIVSTVVNARSADQVELPTGSLRSTSGLLIGAYKSILAKKPKHFQSSVFAGAFFSIPIDSSCQQLINPPTKYCANYLCESLRFSNFIAKTGIYP
jgi:hypothetical protein